MDESQGLMDLRPYIRMVEIVCSHTQTLLYRRLASPHPTPNLLYGCYHEISARTLFSNFLTDPTHKMIVDDANISLMDFAYLMACCLNTFIYKGRNRIYAKVYRPARFCRQLGHNQQLHGIVGRRVLANVSLTEANIHWQECMPSN